MIQTAVSGEQKIQWAPKAKNGEIDPADWPPFQEVRIPFRERKARVKFPNNAKLVVRVYLSPEWSAPLNAEGSAYQPSLQRASSELYSYNAGIYRALDLFERHGIKVSVFPNASAVSAFPAIFKELLRLGHEITARPFSQRSGPISLSAGQEEPMIRRVTDSIAQIIGERPVGWINPKTAGTDGVGTSFTHRTPEILANLGYLWWGDHDGDDIPFGVRFGSKTIVALPYRGHTTQDKSILWDGYPPVRDPMSGFEFFRNTFDAYYLTATTEAPLMMSWGIHPEISCYADRIVWNDRCLSYMKRFNDVWFARHRDVAQYWKDNYLT